MKTRILLTALTLILLIGTKVSANDYQETISITKSYKNSDFLRNIPLDIKYQEYIYIKCRALDINYDIILAKISSESNFNVDAVGYNIDSSGNIKSTDYGVSQINSRNLEWCNELSNKKVDVINNTYDNILCGILIYNEYRNYWKNFGYNGYELEIRTLSSYNMGVSGYKKYINNGNKWDSWKYSIKIMEKSRKIGG